MDGGAVVDPRPAHLVQFAYLIHEYLRDVVGIECPRIGLLSNGEEAGKGTAFVREVHALLKARSDVGFIGNIEANAISEGIVDAVLCDGFSGNLLLKAAEGTLVYPIAGWWTATGVPEGQADRGLSFVRRGATAGRECPRHSGARSIGSPRHCQRHSVGVTRLKDDQTPSRGHFFDTCMKRTRPGTGVGPMQVAARDVRGHRAIARSYCGRGLFLA
jgi:hypothetical protein